MERLRQRAEFVAVAAGARTGTPAFSLQGRARDADTTVPEARIGFTVTKKTGNSVERNRIRRRLREMVKRVDDEVLRRDGDYVLVARREALHRSFDALLTDFGTAAARLNRQISKRLVTTDKPA